MTTLSVCGTPFQFAVGVLSLLVIAVAIPWLTYAYGYGKGLTDIHSQLRDKMGEGVYDDWLDRYWPEEEPHV